jgi:glycerophosphoryl diester phosphodiesterase
MATSQPVLNTRRILRDAGGDMRRAAPQLIGYEILFRIFSAAVLGPVSAWLLAAFIAASGEMAVSNERIVSFLLSPAGIIGGLVWVVAALAGLFAEQAGLILISAESIRGRRLGSTHAFWQMLGRLPAMLDLAARQVAIYALVAVPTAGLMAATYFTLLSGHDINYYLAAQPPVFWVAVAIGLVLGGTAAAIAAALYLRWLLAIPICLLENVKPAAAMRASRLATRGTRPWMAALVFGWAAAVTILGAAGVLLVGWLGDLILAMLGERLALVIPTVAALLVALAAVAVVISFLGFAGNCLLVGRLYFALRPVESPTPTQVEKAETLPPSGQAGGWIPPKRVLWSGAAGLALLTILACYGVLEQMDLEDRVLVTAHRGGSRYAPENSLSAIRQAVTQGADFAEIDVQETADGEVVLLHDSDLKRVAGLDRKIWEVSYPELADVDAGSWFSPEFKDEPIPTLAQAVREAGDRIRLNVELKFNGHDKRLAAGAVEILRREGFQPRCVVTSLEYDGVREAKRLDGRLTVGYIVFRALGDVTRLEADFFSMNAEQVDEALVARLHDAGREIHVWTVNDPRRMSEMIDLGVDNIITDEPGVLIAMLTERAELSDVERLLLRFRNRIW